MKIKCVLIEDELPARELLQNFIQRIDWLELLGSFKRPLDIAGLNWGEVDMLITDIEMGELSGIDYLKTLTNPPNVIITTAYSEHALEGYELDIVDYLLKPFPFERFLGAVNKVKRRIQQAELETPSPLLLIQADHKTYRVKPEDIIFIEGMREYARYHLASEEKILELVSLKRLEETLPPFFIRIHKSFIINKKFIHSFDSVSVEIKGTKIPIGKSYRDGVKDSLSQ